MKTSTLAPTLACSLLVLVGSAACTSSSSDDEDCSAPSLLTSEVDLTVDIDVGVSAGGSARSGFPIASSGSYSEVDATGLPDGVTIGGTSLYGTPTESGTFTVTVRYSTQSTPCAPGSPSSTFTIVVADRPSECKSANDCEVEDRSADSCKTDADCRSSSSGSVCVALDVGGGRCFGGVTTICGECTHDIELTTTEHSSLHDCGYGSRDRFACNERQHCVSSDSGMTCD